MFILADGKLIDYQPVVVIRIVKIDHPRLCPSDGAVTIPIFYRYPIHQHPMDGPVSSLQCRPFRPGQPAEGFADRLCRKLRVNSSESVS